MGDAAMDFHRDICGSGQCFLPVFEGRMPCGVNAKLCSCKTSDKEEEDMNTKKNQAVPATGVFEKTCSKCGKTKPIFDTETGKNNFYKSSISKDGYHPWCKICHNSHTAHKRGSKKQRPSPKIQELASPIYTIPEHKCPKCGRVLELNLENFHANPASKTGFKLACKDCRNKDKRVRRGTEEGCIVLDFSEDKELFGKIQAISKKARRKPAMQIMVMLEEAV